MSYCLGQLKHKYLSASNSLKEIKFFYRGNGSNKQLNLSQKVTYLIRLFYNLSIT